MVCPIKKKKKEVNMEPWFDCLGYKFTRFWHCFGNYNHLADLDTVIGLLQTSTTNVLPINTHRLDDTRDETALEIGYAGVPLSLLARHRDLSSYHKMLNINLQTTADAAIAKTRLAYEMTGEPIIKLEVLEGDHKHSNQAGIVEATTTLNKWDSHLVVFPLFHNDLTVAKQLIDAGSRLLRVMGSGIGSCGGIKDLDTFEKICDLGVPVILDGGIGCVQDAENAMAAGATGILINSMLFQQQESPVEVMTEFSKNFHHHIAELEAECLD